MPKGNIQRGLTAALVGAILIIGVTACGLVGGGEDAEAEVAAMLELEQQATDNVIKLEVLTARFEQLDEANQNLSKRIDMMAEENQKLAGRVTQLESGGATAGAGAATATAQPSLGPAWDAASAEDRAAVRDFAKCTTEQASGGLDPAEVSLLIDAAEMANWQAIDAGSLDVPQLRVMRALVCSQ